MSYIFKQVNDFGVIFHDHFSWYHYEIFHVRWRFTKLSRNLQITAWGEWVSFQWVESRSLVRDAKRFLKHFFWSSMVFMRIRSSHSQMFYKITAPKNFANFTGRHLCWSLFLIRLQALCNRTKNFMTTSSL